jgi:hypothetical protein
VAITVSCITAALVASATSLPSVWCFFAAMLSFGLYLHFRIEARTTANQPSTSVNFGTLAN